MRLHKAQAPSRLSLGSKHEQPLVRWRISLTEHCVSIELLAL